jgi:uncharacterized membrane protein YgcG
MQTRHSPRGPLLKSVTLLVLTLVAVPALGLACQNCEFALLSSNRYCMDVVDEETGVTNCIAIYTIWGIPVDCTESGNFCSNIDAGGGGDGGSGGSGSGGGSGCGSTGFCSAECFSCPGPGRPAV